jgi:subtilisin family serine protease
MRLPTLRVSALLLATCLVTVAAPAQAGADDRFGTRAWFTGVDGRAASVVVDARLDLYAVRVPGAVDHHAVARLVEDLLLKVAGADVTVVESWDLGGRDAVAVMLTGALTPPQAAALQALVEDSVGGHLWPAVGRGPRAANGHPAGRAFVDDRLVVTAAPGRLDAVLTLVADKTGATLLHRSRLGDTALVQVGAASGFDAITASVVLKGLPGVVSAEPDLARELSLKATANDPLFNSQWHLGRQPGDTVPGVGEIFADDAWDTTRGNPDVVVAVFDSGTDWEHPDLIANVRQDLMFDSSAGDPDPKPECEASQDGAGESPLCSTSARPFRESHGTSVSGTIAAVADNELGVAGVCPRCSLAPVRLLGEATSSGLTIAEAFAKSCDPDNDGTGRGSWIINNSWGPGFSLFFPLSRAERDAFDVCRTVGREGKGTVIVFAAGNATSDVSSDAYAKNPYVISVAASTNLDDWAAYSNFGAEVDVAAPSLGGTVNEDNYGIVCTDVRGVEGYSIDADGFDLDYNPGFSGTSASSPVTAGVAGLVLSANPNLSAEQVRLVLTATADKIRANQVPWPDIFGQDIEAAFEYDDNGHSIGFGYGRVNAREAVAVALDPTSLGTAGVRCDTVDAAACPVCSANNLCLTACTAQSDCAMGSVCNVELGACELPIEGKTDFLAPCDADCAYCVGTLNTQFEPTTVCSIECTTDADCDPSCEPGEDCRVDSFDCRPATSDPNGVRICAVGDPNGGGPADFGACFNQQLFTSVLVESEEGKELCGDICFSEGPGSCPYGFHCAEVTSECTRDSQFGCREVTVYEAGPVGSGSGDFYFPICVPNPGHADRCTLDADCQAGDYCDPTGDCRYDDRAGCDICTACTTSDDCGGRGACVGTLAADGSTQPGVCATTCDDGERCPGDAACRSVDVYAQGRNGVRIQTLQVCLADGVPDFVGATPQDFCEDFSCAVACRADVPCAGSEVCTDGVCGAAPAEGEGEGEAADISLGGGGLRCGGCDASGPDASLLGLGLLGLLSRRRRR